MSLSSSRKCTEYSGGNRPQMDRQVRTDSYVGRILKREFVELQLVGWGCVCVYIDGPGTE